MPFEMRTLPLPLSAEIFGALALRMDAAASFALDTRVVIERSESSGAGTLLDDQEIRNALKGDFSDEILSSFLGAVSAGRLSDYRYDLKAGQLRTPDGVHVPMAREALISLQQPLAPALNAPRGPVNGSVPLTISGVYLENIARIPASAFEEAAFRALGLRDPENLDLLWMHAGEGRLRRYDVTEAVLLTANPPQGVSPSVYRKDPSRFPVVCLQHDRATWKLEPRHVIGNSEIASRVLSVLEKTDWNLQISGRPKRREASRESIRQTLIALIRRSEPPPPPPQPPAPHKKPAPASSPRATEPPLPERVWPVSDVFFRPHQEMLYRGRRGMVGITEVDVPVESLASVPRIFFERAARWALGARDARDGDLIVLTSGENFSKDGRIRDCLFVCGDIPASRKAPSYPKVWLEMQKGRWVVLSKSRRGQANQALIGALAEFTDWGIVSEFEK